MVFFSLMLFIIIVFVQPQEFIPAVRNMPLVSYVMGFTAVTWFFTNYGSKKIVLFNTNQNVLMFIFWFIIVFSTLGVGYFSYTIETFIEWGKFVVIYFLIINIISSKKQLIISVWVFVLGATFLAITGILQSNGIDLTGVGIVYGTRIRGIGIFDTNQLAYTLAFTIPLISSLFLLSRSFIIKICLLLDLIAFYYAIYLTDSRGGIICSIFVLLMMLIYFVKSNILRIIGFFIVLTVLGLLLTYSSRLNTISDYEKDSSAMGRINVWGEALIGLKSSPILGVGKGQFNEHYSISPHNSYIQVAAELGLSGLFIWIALFYYSIVDLRKISKNNKCYKIDNEGSVQIILSNAFQMSLYAYLIGSIWSGNTYYITLYILFALIYGLRSISAAEIFEKSPQFYVVDIKNIFAIGFTILFLIHILSKIS